MLAQLPQTGIITNSLISSLDPAPTTTTSLISPITQSSLVVPVYALSTPLVSQSLVTVPQIQTGTNYLTVSEAPLYMPQYQIMNLSPVNYDTSTIVQYQTVVPGTVQVGVNDLGASQIVQYPTTNAPHIRTVYKPVVKTGYQSVINYKPVLKTNYHSAVNYEPVVKTGNVPQVETNYLSIPLN